MTRRAKGEGSVFQQRDGRWVGRVDLGPDPRTGRRRRRKVTAATKAGAAKRLRELHAEITAGLDSRDRPSVGDLADRWLNRVASARSSATQLADDAHVLPTSDHTRDRGWQRDRFQ